MGDALRIADGLRIVPQQTDHDQFLTFDFLPRELVARESFFVTPNGAKGLQILGIRGGQKLFNSSAGRRATRQRTSRRRMAGRDGENEQNG